MNEPNEYKIADVFTVYMVQGPEGFHGYYDNHLTNKRNSFEAPGMTRKQVIRTFWDWVKNNNTEEIE